MSEARVSIYNSASDTVVINEISNTSLCAHGHKLTHLHINTRTAAVNTELGIERGGRGLCCSSSWFITDMSFLLWLFLHISYRKPGMVIEKTARSGDVNTWRCIGLSVASVAGDRWCFPPPPTPVQQPIPPPSPLPLPPVA